MKIHFRIWLVFSVLFWGVLSSRIEAQDVEGDRGFSIGGHFTGLLLDRLGEGAPGFGGRAAYDFPLKNSVILSPEIEVNHFPANPSGNFGETELLAGGKIGVRRGKTGIFAKLRPGLLHIPGHGDFGERNGGAADLFALDAGIVLEHWVRQRFCFRLDLGDTMVYFPSPVNTGVGAPRASGLSHNLQFGVGVMVHF